MVTKLRSIAGTAELHVKTNFVGVDILEVLAKRQEHRAVVAAHLHPVLPPDSEDRSWP